MGDKRVIPWHNRAGGTHHSLLAFTTAFWGWEVGRTLTPPTGDRSTLHPGWAWPPSRRRRTPTCPAPSILWPARSKPWCVPLSLLWLGVARGIAKGNAKIYASTPVMGAIIVHDRDEDFITAGRLMERLWLKATSWGLSFHVITGVLFFHQVIQSGKKDQFSEEQIRIIENAYQNTTGIFGVKDKLVTIMFRMGEDGEPSARSIKKVPEVMYT